MEIMSNDFQNEVLNSDIPVIVDFFATWCGPCKMMSSVLHEFAEKFAGKIKVVKIDIDKSMDLAEKYRIMSVPTLILFQNGEAVKQTVGYMDADELTAFAF